MNHDASRGIFTTELDPGEAWFEAESSGLAEGENGLPSWEAEWEGEWEDDGAGYEQEMEELREAESPFVATEGERLPGRQLLTRGSQGPEVARAQTLLNRFLPQRPTSLSGCINRSPRHLQELARELEVLRRGGQLPLVVDGRFGPQTERAVRVFQSCLGLVRDGKVGPVTWDYLERQGGGHPSPPRPPEPRTCGLPSRSEAELEHALDLEAEMLGETRRRRGTAVSPRLSLFLNDSKSSARNHFQCQASRVARRLGALAVGREDPCTTRRVGPTSYDTGADIVGAISSAHSCLRRRISAVHIFGHSGPGGIYGAAVFGTEGLYTTIDAAARRGGAREINDLPASALSDDVVVILHGCNQGAGTGSFAEHLYRHLRGTLGAPVVLAHYNGGCAGRDDSWIRFDNRTPTGRRVRSIAPHYSGGGCCERRPRSRSEANDEAAAAPSWPTSERQERLDEDQLELASYSAKCGCGRRS